jgi:hypothetical protein
MSRGESESTQQHRGTGFKARFTGWEIAEPMGESPNILSTLNPVRIRFCLDVRQPIDHAHHGIALFDSDRHLMWALATDNLSFDAGVIELCYDFPFLPLRPGPYFWQVSLWDDDGNVDLWDAVPEMLITTENYQHIHDEWNGVFNLPSTLSISARQRIQN